MTDNSHEPTASWPALKERASILRSIRAFFDDRGYTEVQTPLLSHDIVVDAHLDPFSLETEYGRLFLQTSPEFAMKRLLVAGADAIYQICHAFRRGEVGARHNPEFCMLEWYKVGDTYHDQMAFTEELVRTALANRLPLSANSFVQTTYDEAFERAAGRRVSQLEAPALAEFAAMLVNVPESIDRSNRDDILNLLLAEVVEPTLGVDAPEFLYDYPSTQAALARVRDGKPSVAERFELYFRGLELCNGYQELTDANELRRRNQVQNGLRTDRGEDALPEDSRLLQAMDAGLPESSGVALGVDRLVALACGLERIDEVWPFPIQRA